MDTYEVYFRLGGQWVRVAMEGASPPVMNINGYDSIVPRLDEFKTFGLLLSASELLTPRIVDTSVPSVSGGINKSGSDIVRPVVVESNSTLKNNYGIGNDLLRASVVESTSIIKSLTKGATDILRPVFTEFANIPEGTQFFESSDFEATDFE